MQSSAERSVSTASSNLANIVKEEIELDRALVTRVKAAMKRSARAWLGLSDPSRTLIARLYARAATRLPRVVTGLFETAPRQIELFEPLIPRSARRSRILLVSHDLSASGAPILLADIASAFLAQNFDVTVVSPEDGRTRHDLCARGATVVVDSDLFRSSTLTARLIDEVGAVVCNTIITANVVRQASPRVPCFWYVHEVSLLERRLQEDQNLPGLFSVATGVWAGSEMSAALIRPYRRDVLVLPYGRDPLNTPTRPPGIHKLSRLRIALFGSVEPRKGQDLALSALELLTSDEREQLQLLLYGRILDTGYAQSVLDAASNQPSVTYGGELEISAYQQAVSSSDAIIVPSRDDTLPLVTIDAWGAGRVLMCTATTGTSTYIADGVNGFVAPEPSAKAIAEMLSRALSAREEWPRIGAAGRTTFESVFSRSQFNDKLTGIVNTAISTASEEASAQ